MKVVIATPFYPPEIGVLATYAYGIESGLKNAGHTVVVVKLNTALPVGLRQFVYFAHLFQALPSATFLLSLDMTSVGIPAFLASRLLRVPLALRIGGDSLWEQYVERTSEPVRLSDFYISNPPLSRKERFMRAVFVRILSGAKHVFFNTVFQKNIWQREYQLVEEKISVLENFYPPVHHTEKATAPIFIGANRGALYKNADLLARAFDSVRSKYPDIRLDTRALPYNKQLQRLASAYAAIIPSISEVGSNIAIECVTMGRPFIITDDTGTKERLSECGLFIDTRSEEALIHAIESLLDAKTYESLSERCRSFTFTHSWDEIATEVLSTMQH